MFTARRALTLLSLFVIALVLSCGGGGGDLPDPGLSNVKVETSRARAATIGPEGGSLSVTGSNGFVYTLTVPPDAITRDAQIRMYPITKLLTLPSGASTQAGVDFAPEGFTFAVPATLTITVPPRIDPHTLVPVAFTGNGANPLVALGIVNGQTITQSIFHFSGTVLGNRQIPDLLQVIAPTPATESFQHRMGVAFFHAQDTNASPEADYRQILTDWYNTLVKPDLLAGTSDPATVFPRAALGYGAWLDALLYAQLTLGQSGFTIPQLAESEPLAVALLKALYRFENDRCVAEKNDPDPSVPVRDADAGFSVTKQLAAFWHLPIAANNLDDQHLLDGLCAKVVIETRSFSAAGPGESGNLLAIVGYTLDGGPVRHDLPLRVRFSRGGSTIGTGTANSDGVVTRPFTWPPDADPLTVGVLANINIDRFTNHIARFDLITKSLGSGDTDQIVFQQTAFWFRAVPPCSQIPMRVQTVGLAAPGVTLTASSGSIERVEPVGTATNFVYHSTDSPGPVTLTATSATDPSRHRSVTIQVDGLAGDFLEGGVKGVRSIRGDDAQSGGPADKYQVSILTSQGNPAGPNFLIAPSGPGFSVTDASLGALEFQIEFGAIGGAPAWVGTGTFTPPGGAVETLRGGHLCR